MTRQLYDSNLIITKIKLKYAWTLEEIDNLLSQAQLTPSQAAKLDDLLIGMGLIGNRNSTNFN